MKEAFSAPIFHKGPDMYYVLYSPSKKMYLDEDGEYCKYEQAEKHPSPFFTSMFEDVKWVGPCMEGEEP